MIPHYFSLYYIYIFEITEIILNGNICCFYMYVWQDLKYAENKIIQRLIL